jgi:hypothetical protein
LALVFAIKQTLVDNSSKARYNFFMNDLMNEMKEGYSAALKIHDALEIHNKIFETFFYTNSQDGSYNNLTPCCHKKAAALSWERTIDAFNKNLKS